MGTGGLATGAKKLWEHRIQVNNEDELLRALANEMYGVTEETTRQTPTAKENTTQPKALDGMKYSLRGINQKGIEVYEISKEVQNLSYKDRIQKFQNIMRNEYRGRTAKFQKNGQTYYAQFQDTDVRKNIYGDKKSDSKGRSAKSV